MIEIFKCRLRLVATVNLRNTYRTLCNKAERPGSDENNTNKKHFS